MSRLEALAAGRACCINAIFLLQAYKELLIALGSHPWGGVGGRGVGWGLNFCVGSTPLREDKLPSHRANPEGRQGPQSIFGGFKVTFICRKKPDILSQ